MNEIVLVFFLIVLVAVCLFVIRQYFNIKKEYKNYQEKVKAEEIERQKKEELKSQIYNGNGDTFDNIADILRNNQNRK